MKSNTYIVCLSGVFLNILDYVLTKVGLHLSRGSETILLTEKNPVGQVLGCETALIVTIIVILLMQLLTYKLCLRLGGREYCDKYWHLLAVIPVLAPLISALNNLFQVMLLLTA